MNKIMIGLVSLITAFSSIQSVTLAKKCTEFVSLQNGLIRPIPANLADKPIINLATGAIQKDAWSCGYHAIFNARAMDLALQKTNQFHEELKTTLCDQSIFNDTLKIIQECPLVKAHLEKEVCLNGYHIAEVCKLLPLKDRCLSLFLQEDKFAIPCLHVPHIADYPVHGNEKEKNAWVVQRQAELSETIVRQRVLDLRAQSNAGLHIIGNLSNHFVNFSIITDSQAHAQLYFVGAWNETISDPRVMKYITKLLPYVEAINARP